MTVDAHRQINVTVPGNRLSQLGSHACLRQIGNECVPISVEVGVQSVVVAIWNSGSFEVEPHHL